MKGCKNLLFFPVYVACLLGLWILHELGIVYVTERRKDDE